MELVFLVFLIELAVFTDWFGLVTAGSGKTVIAYGPHATVIQLSD